MKFFLCSLSAAAVLLTGCAATVQKSSDIALIKVNPESARHIAMYVTGPRQVIASADWAAFKREWYSAMRVAAETIGARFSWQDDKANPTGEPGTLMVVNVNDYRYLSAGSRIAFGRLTGNAFVDSSVQFMDLKTGALLGEKRYNTSTSAWQGRLAPMTDKQIQAITAEIAAEIKAR
jgi:hypothetical protein